MDMFGTVFLVLLCILSQVHNLSSDEDRVSSKHKVRHGSFRIPPTLTAKNKTGRRFRQLIKHVEEKLHHRFERKYNKKFRDLKVDIDRLETKTKRAIRRLQKEHRCPYGYIPHHGRCFRFVMSQTKWMEWEKARDFCQNEGANLVYLNSTSKHQFVVSYLRKNFGMKAPTVFTSGVYTDETRLPFSLNIDTHTSRRLVNPSWYWEGNVSPVGNDPSNTHWCNGTIPKPSDILHWDGCLALSRSCEGWNWTGVKCGSKQPFICELKLVADD